MSGRWLDTQNQSTRSNQTNACTSGRCGATRKRIPIFGIIKNIQNAVKEVQTRIVVLASSRMLKTSRSTFLKEFNLARKEQGPRAFLTLLNQIFPGLSNGPAPSVPPWVGRAFGEDTPGLGFIVENSAGIGMMVTPPILTRTLVLGQNGADLDYRTNTKTLTSQTGHTLCLERMSTPTPDGRGPTAKV